MTKILIIGNSPLPNDNRKTRPAAGLRTFQFLEAVRRGVSDAELRVVTIDMEDGAGNEVFDARGDVNINKSDSGLLKKVQKVHDEFRPTVIVSVNTFPSHIACSLKTESVIWADLNGWIMSEAQAQAFKQGGNSYLSHYYNIERSVIDRADKISTVSLPQKHALLGELAFSGRLNNETFGYEFLHHVPNGTEVFCGERETMEASSEVTSKIPGEGFKLLWLGGYNTWVDEETLFKGVEAAMAAREDLYYVSTGGRISGLDDKTFENFLRRVERSRFKERFVFLGWVKTEEIPSIYKECDLGLNVDRMCTETLTGARNRINEMMKFGMPVLSSLGSEISFEVAPAGAGFVFESGNFEKFSARILEAYDLWKEDALAFGKLGENGATYIKEECNYEKTCAELVDFLCKSPRRAPDYKVRVKLKKSSFSFAAVLKYMKDNGFRQFARKVLQKLKF